MVGGFSRVVREKPVSGSIRQLSVSKRTTVVLPLTARRIRMWGLDLRERRAWHSGGVRLLIIITLGNFVTAIFYKL